MATELEYQQLRAEMVSDQLVIRDISDTLVVDAMLKVPRHKFVSDEYLHLAYHDRPLPIGENQTISQPYIVAMMSQLLDLHGGETVLEIGTGCGYQTAVLCEIADYVYSVERYARLASRAGDTLTDLGYDNFELLVGDGSQGLADMAPFDAIIVTAAAPSIPGPLISQLKRDSGKLVLPVGNRYGQILSVAIRDGDTYAVENHISVRFVPLQGRYGFPSDNANTSV